MLSLERTTKQEGWCDNDYLPAGWKLSFTTASLLFLFISDVIIQEGLRALPAQCGVTTPHPPVRPQTCPDCVSHWSLVTMAEKGPNYHLPKLSRGDQIMRIILA